MAFPTYQPQNGPTYTVIAPNLAQHARGTSATFEVSFFEDPTTNSTPMVPANASLYPAYSIMDPSGVVVANGVGIAGSGPGRWQTAWNVPTNAALSTQSSKWIVVWTMTTATNRQAQQKVPFDVVELRTPESLEDLSSTAYMVYQGNSERLILRLPARPDSLTVTGRAATTMSDITPQATVAFSGSLALGTIVEVEEQNLYAYYFDTPPMNSLGEYQIVWNVRMTPTSRTETDVRKLYVPPPVFFSLGDSLKVLIDKLQKKYGTAHAYADADVYQHYLNALGTMNAVTPVTNWDLTTFPYNSITTRYLIEAAALHAMKAQHILAGELQFSFSGQTVTLDVDHTGMYSEVIDKLREDLTGDGKGGWPAAKVGFMRTRGPIAHVANRMMGRTQNQQYTYKMYSTNVGSDSPTLFSAFPGASVGLGFTLTDLQVYLGLY